jgi:Bacterial protein of unknown function (DUF885)
VGHRRINRVWPLATLTVLVAACNRETPRTAPSAASAPAASAAAAPPAAAPGDTWPQFAAAFIEAYFKANPFFAAQAGRHEFDGQMPDWSAAGIGAEVARLQQLRTQAAAFDTAALAPADRFERDYLLSVIDTDLFWLDRARFPFSNPAWYIDQLDPDIYLNRDYAPLATRLRGYIGYLRSIPRLASAIRANLHVPLPPSFVKRGVDAFGGFAAFYRKDAPAVFASVRGATAQKDLAEASAAAAARWTG